MNNPHLYRQLQMGRPEKDSPRPGKRFDDIPLGFSDEELNSITALASPLPPAMRSDFLRLVAGRIEGYPPQERGPGLVHRIAVEAQKDFLKPLSRGR